MWLNNSILKKPMIIIGFFCFTTYFSKTQSINHYFRFHPTDKATISTGVYSQQNKCYGIALRADSANDSHLTLYDIDSSEVIHIIDDKRLNSTTYVYIQTQAPKFDLKERICHAYSNENLNTGNINGSFIIYDIKGNTKIDSVYKNTYNSGFSDFIQQPDSSFILFGTSNEFDANGDFYIVHVDKNGGFISDTTYGITNREERGYAIAATPDSGFVFTGYYRTAPHGHPDFRSKIAVYKIDKTGKVEWDKLYGGDFKNTPYQICYDELDSIFRIVGLSSSQTTTTNNYFNDSPYILQVSQNGDLLFDVIDTIITDSAIFRGYSTDLLIEGKNSYVSSIWDFFVDRSKSPTHPASITKFRDSVLIWKSYLYNFQSPSSQHILYSIEKTNDGGFVLGGTIVGKAPDPVGQFGWIVKTDSMGCVAPGCQLVGVEENVTLRQAQEPELLLYPNPKSPGQQSWLSFNLQNQQKVTLTITNINGSLVKQKNVGLLPKGVHQMQLNIELNAGIYLVTLKTKTNVQVLKWVVE